MTEVGRECLRAEAGVRKGRWGRKGSYCRVSMWGRRVGDVGRVGKAERASKADRAGEDLPAKNGQMDVIRREEKSSC